MYKVVYKLVVLLAILTLALGTAGAALAAGPGLTVSNLKDGDRIAGTTVTVNFAVTNFEIVPSSVPISEAGKHPELNQPGQGHLHFMLDMQPLVVWEESKPYTFLDIPPGDHQLMVELANNDHSSLSPRVLQQIHFQTGLPLASTGAGIPFASSVLYALLGLAALMLVAGTILRVRRTA
jgi:hypothetical protein